MGSVVETMTFSDWIPGPPPRGHRLGQHLFNSAPEHIRKAVAGVMELDPFYVNSNEQMYIVNNFLEFVRLCWDVTDGEEMRIAIGMVLSEPKARR